MNKQKDMKTKIKIGSCIEEIHHAIPAGLSPEEQKRLEKKCLLLNQEILKAESRFLSRIGKAVTSVLGTGSIVEMEHPGHSFSCIIQQHRPDKHLSMDASEDIERPPVRNAKV